MRRSTCDEGGGYKLKVGGISGSAMEPPAKISEKALAPLLDDAALRRLPRALKRKLASASFHRWRVV